MSVVTITGSVDYVENYRSVYGWAFSPDLQDNRPLVIEIRNGKHVLGRGSPTLRRDDLSHLSDQPIAFAIQADADLDPHDLCKEIITVHAISGSVEVRLPYYITALDATKVQLARDLLKSRSITGDVYPEQLSSVLLPVGMISDDGSTRLGREGNLFLSEGSNKVGRLYERTSENDRTSIEIAERWTYLFETRKRRIEGAGSKYIQMVIPEKQSVQPHFLDLDIVVPTPNLERLEQMAKAALSQSYLSAIDTLRDGERAERTYRQNDTHLSTHGSMLISAAIGRLLGIELPEEFPFRMSIREGDVGLRFLSVPVWEDCKEAIEIPGTDKPAVVEDFDPGGGKHIGRRLRFRNERPLSKLKVACFGNSFFERGYTSRILTWWMSRMFEEFHFFWEPAVDYEHIDAIKPDVVIAQTIERFLMQVPSE